MQSRDIILSVANVVPICTELCMLMLGEIKLEEIKKFLKAKSLCTFSFYS